MNQSAPAISHQPSPINSDKGFVVTYAGLAVYFVDNACGYHFNIAPRGKHQVFGTESEATTAAVRSGMRLFSVKPESDI